MQYFSQISALTSLCTIANRLEMDNLTHALTGALMGQMGLKRVTGLGMAALVLGANLPDIDVIGLLWLDSTQALEFRRGITHGPLGVVLLPLGLAALLCGFDRWQEGRGTRPDDRRPVRFIWIYILGLIGAISHVLMDWLNVYGVRFLYPFDKSWYYGDTLFIIDAPLWVILGLGIWWSVRAQRGIGKRRIPRALGMAASAAFVGEDWAKSLVRGVIAGRGGSRRKAWVAMLVAIVYVCMNWAITARDKTMNGQISVARPVQYISSPAPIFPWKRERIAQFSNGLWLSNGWAGPPYQYGYKYSDAVQCAMPDLSEARKTNRALDAYLIWSRAPFAEKARDGSIILRDARYYDPRARARFSLALPDYQCEELGSD